MQIGYHASHEQFPPSALLRLVARAQQAGFDAASCSDHFHPWSPAQGHSGHAWSWLGAAMAVTRLPFGVVTCPSGRYHPAVVAQAVATLAEMHPDRFWLAAGSGEALNEAITGERWPSKPQRNARLREAVEVMRALWDGEEVDHAGSFTVQRARLYTRPQRRPQVFAAALSEDTARWAAGWADGLITVSLPGEALRRTIEAFREGGGADKPVVLQAKLSYAKSEAEALAGAHHQWRTNVLPADVSEVLRMPAQFEALGALVTPEHVREHVRVSSDPGRHAAWLHGDAALGVSAVYCHNVNRGQERFIDEFGAAVIPQLR